jgi:hypothetical protein
MIIYEKCPSLLMTLVYMHLNEMQGSLGNDVELLNEINKSKM